MNTSYNDNIDLGEYSFLLVDPNRYERTLLRNILLQLHARQILEVNDATEASEILLSEKLDFLMLEYDLPRVDGVKLVHGVRRGLCGRSNIEMQIFMMSGRRDAESVYRARNCGIHFFIAKPFSLQAMRDRVHATLTRPREFIRSDEYIGPDRRWGGQTEESVQPALIKTPVVHDMTGDPPRAASGRAPKAAAAG